MRKERILSTLIALLLALPFFGCADLDPASPGAVDTGRADFTRYVALGNSLTAGFQSGGLVEKYQEVSYPALIAKAAGAQTFEMPIISEPGIPPLMFARSLSPVILDTLDGQGSPANLSYAGIYNNLGVPGATLNQLLTSTPADANPFFGIVLRDPGLGLTVLEQAMNMNPTFITLWIGFNDVLGSVLKGSDLYMTPVQSFLGDFRELVDSLKTRCNDIVAANLPDVTSVPFATTVPPVLVDPLTQEVITDSTGAPIPLIGYVQGVPGPLPLTARVLLNAAPHIAPPELLGVPTAVGGSGIPLPDSLVLDATEQANIVQRVMDFNAIIDSICTNRSIPVVDIYNFFNEIGTKGATIRGDEFTTDFLSGGLFSVDGIHPSTLGYYLIADEFIDKINAGFDAKIPPAYLPAYP